MMFKDRNAFQHYIVLRGELSNEDERATFSLALRRAYDKKVADYKLTEGDIDLVFARLPVAA